MEILCYEQGLKNREISDIGRHRNDNRHRISIDGKIGKNRQNRRYIGEILVKHRFIGEKSRVDLTRGATGGEFKNIAENIADFSVFLPIFRKISRYFLPVQPAHRIQNLAQKSWI